MAAAGNHPHVVRYYLGWLESRSEGLFAYLQMEKCEVSLGTQLAVHGQPFREAQLLAVLTQVWDLASYFFGHDCAWPGSGGCIVLEGIWSIQQVAMHVWKWVVVTAWKWHEPVDACRQNSHESIMMHWRWPYPAFLCSLARVLLLNGVLPTSTTISDYGQRVSARTPLPAGNRAKALMAAQLSHQLIPPVCLLWAQSALQTSSFDPC